MSHLEDENAFSNECVLRQLALVMHTWNDSGDLVPWDQPRFLLSRPIESLEVSWCQRYALDAMSKMSFACMFNCRHV